MTLGFFCCPTFHLFQFFLSNSYDICCGFPSTPAVPVTLALLTSTADAFTNSRLFQEPPACHLFIQELLSCLPTSNSLAAFLWDAFALARDIIW